MLNNCFDAIILAAGESVRYSHNVSKVFLPFKNTSVIDNCINIIKSHPNCLNLVIVVNKKHLEKFKDSNSLKSLILMGGKTRTQSVKIGIKALQKKNNVKSRKILIHDAARPGISHKIINNLLKAFNEKCSGVVPGLTANDSLAYKHKDSSQSIIRKNAYRIQTPQIFKKEVLEILFDKKTFEFNDEAELLRKHGYDVKIIQGDEKLIKITTPTDYETLINFFNVQMITKVGNGFDVHSFSNSKENFFLCGIKIPFTKTLLGHSDADVALHALTDSILGALSAGDIGQHFPPNDRKWKNIDSSIFLEKSLEILVSNGATLTNIDLTIICEEPKISPYKEKMIENLSRICVISKKHISIKATTTENLGFLGRKEGIAVLATSSILVPFEK